MLSWTKYFGLKLCEWGDLNDWKNVMSDMCVCVRACVNLLLNVCKKLTYMGV